MLNETSIELLNPVAQVSLAFTVVCVVLGLAVAQWYKSSLGIADYIFTVWLVFDILIHVFLEGSFVVISLTGTVRDSRHILAETWKEYAKADARWGISNPTIVSLEILTVTIATLFACLTLYGMLNQKFYRHFCQICLCVCELYGGWMTFCPEWLTGSKNLRTDNFLYLWVYLVFFNGLWVVLPVAMLYQSWEALRDSMVFKDSQGRIVHVKENKMVYTKTYTTFSNTSNNKSFKED